MKVYFLKQKGQNLPFSQEDRIELYPDIDWETSKFKPWDDFGYQTTFEIKLFYQDKEYELPAIKILFENEKNTHNIFKNILLEEGSLFFEFPIEEMNYVSLPTDTEFYTALYSLLELSEITTILNSLHDASYINNTNNLPKYKFLFKSEGFYNSLTRDMTSKKALEYGWFIVTDRTLSKETFFTLDFQLGTYSNRHNVEINFKKSIFPNNINVLIGSNGSGKSQTLMHLIEELLGIGETQQVCKMPFFNQIVTVAYSPFETYRTSLMNTTLAVKTVYKYFGFRDKANQFNQNLPNIISIKSVFSMLKEDKNKDYFRNRPNKYDTFLSVISSAVDFDHIGFEIDRIIDWQPHNNNKIIDEKFYMIIDKDDFFAEIHIYDEHINTNRGIVFFKDSEVIELSSGQQIFSQLISSIVSSIREDTLVIIDEPELYLHPNLEVELMKMLKEILKIYDSYAVIATHSSIIAREVAREYISVFKKIENTIQVTRPPFETFGGDMEKINSYVFYDKDIKKPYENWLRTLVHEAGSAKAAIEKHRELLNEESIILMYGMGE